MTNFQTFLGWAFIIAGLLSSVGLFLFAIRKYRKETMHSFSFRDFMLGKNRTSLGEPSLQTFAWVVLTLLGVALLYFMLFWKK